MCSDIVGPALPVAGLDRRTVSVSECSHSETFREMCEAVGTVVVVVVVDAVAAAVVVAGFGTVVDAVAVRDSACHSPVTSMCSMDDAGADG